MARMTAIKTISCEKVADELVTKGVSYSATCNEVYT